jgi:CBS domain-containing protein
MVGAGAIIVVLYFRMRNPPLDLDILDGIWLAMVGWFLSSSAVSSYRQVAWREAMQDITAASAMVSDFMTISPDMTLMQLVRDYIQPNRYRSFVVATEGTFQGMVNVENIRKVPQNRWDTTPAGLVMTPAAKVITVPPEEEGVNVAEKMEEYRLDGIPVVRDGVVTGMVTRSSLARVMQMRAQFGTG